MSGGGHAQGLSGSGAAHSTTILTMMYAPCEVANTVISSPDSASGMIVCSNQVRQRFMKLDVWGEDSVTKRGQPLSMSISLTGPSSRHSLALAEVLDLWYRIILHVPLS